MAKVKGKTKRPVIDDEADIVPPEAAVELPAAFEVPAKRADPAMVLDMEGLGGAVASALIVNGLRAYLSVVNKGVGVVAANRAHTAFVAVRVEACADGLDVKRDEAKALVDGHGVLAFLLEDGDERASYYLPVSEYLEMAEDRGESGLRLVVDEHAKWLEKYEGHPGIRRAFARLLG